jgi:very-short-patch-repair endonuclease
MEAMSPSETSSTHNTLSLRERAGVRVKITKQLSKNLRKNQTKAEIKIWRHLKNRALAGFKFRRQCPIGPYIVDFVCLEKMVVIEIDGGQHAEQMKIDARRTAYLKSRGFEVLRFWNNEVLANTDSILSVILATLVNTPSSPALLPEGEGRMAILAQSVNDICTADDKYSPSPSGRGQG